jgi:hypothetical protein
VLLDGTGQTRETRAERFGMLREARAAIRNPLIADTAAVSPAPLPRGGGRCAMDEEALTRILDAVGSKFIPADLDRDGLRAEIQLAAWWWMQITGENKQLARLDRPRDIRQVAEDLKRLLEEDAQSGLGLSEYPFTGSDPPTALNQLTNYVNRLLEPLDGRTHFALTASGAVRRVLPPASRHSAISVSSSDTAIGVARVSSTEEEWTGPVMLKGSALDWAVSSLMDTYTRYFRRKAAFSRTGGEVAGPFIRFAEAALRELKIFNDGKPYSRETIARAVTVLKPREPRGV